MQSVKIIFKIYNNFLSRLLIKRILYRKIILNIKEKQKKEKKKLSLNIRKNFFHQKEAKKKRKQRKEKKKPRNIENSI